MTIPSTGVKLSAIQTEFGGANPIHMSEYRKGAGYVAANQAAGAEGTQIPSSGTIRIGMFRGITKTPAISVTISPQGGSFARSSTASGGTFSQPFTAQPVGVGPYSYAWTRLSGTGLTSANTSSQQMTLSKAYNKNLNADYQETWQVVVTDNGAGGATASSTMNVSVSIASNV